MSNRTFMSNQVCITTSRTTISTREPDGVHYLGDHAVPREVRVGHDFVNLSLVVSPLRNDTLTSNGSPG